jgi:hypothetical protein
MHGYWKEIRARWWEEFFDKARKLTFLITQASTIIVAFFVEYRKVWDGLKYSVGVAFVPFAALALYTLKHAFEDHHEELHKKYVAEGDGKTAARDEVRRLTEQLDPGKKLLNPKKSQQLVELVQLQGEGLTLKLEIEKTFVDPKHKDELAAWLVQVSEFMKKNFPTQTATLFFGGRPATSGRKDALALVEHILERLQTNIDRLGGELGI